jgi:hypothetical protein
MVTNRADSGHGGQKDTGIASKIREMNQQDLTYRGKISGLAVVQVGLFFPFGMFGSWTSCLDFLTF